VFLEIDSLEWHLSPGSYWRTQARQLRLARVGLIVLPVTPAAVRDDPRAFIEGLKIALEATPAATGSYCPQPGGDGHRSQRYLKTLAGLLVESALGAGPWRACWV
jgi:hypothetical protein